MDIRITIDGSNNSGDQGGDLDAEANRWTRAHPRPGRSVEAAAVGVEQGSAAGGSGSGNWLYGGLGANPPSVLVEAIICADPWACFRQGYRWPAEEAYDVMMCESNGNPNTISPNWQNIGLFQINLVHGYSMEYLLQPANNITVAYALWLDRGWAPWACVP